MRRPMAGSVGPSTLITRKLLSGSKGSTRSSPASRAGTFCGSTFTRFAYDRPSTSTNPPDIPRRSWQNASIHVGLKIVVWICAKRLGGPVSVGVGEGDGVSVLVDVAVTVPVAGG